jgi:hypothetical protein
MIIHSGLHPGFPDAGGRHVLRDRSAQGRARFYIVSDGTGKPSVENPRAVVHSPGSLRSYGPLQIADVDLRGRCCHGSATDSRGVLQYVSITARAPHIVGRGHRRTRILGATRAPLIKRIRLWLKGFKQADNGVTVDLTIDGESHGTGRTVFVRYHQESARSFGHVLSIYLTPFGSCGMCGHVEGKSTGPFLHGTGSGGHGGRTETPELKAAQRRL